LSLPDRLKRPPFQGLATAASRIGLPAWFVAIDLLWLVKPGALAIDARHYQKAATVWLAGGDPWKVVEPGGGTYAGGPHTLLFYAPTSLLPFEVSVALWMGLGAAAAIWLVRHFGVPWWWVLFPPLFHAAWNGNPQTISLALLVLGTTWGAIIAVGLKLYTALALVRRPRALVVVGVVLAVALLVLPWQPYIDSGFGVSEHLGTAWNGSAWRFPILVPVTLVALWILRNDGAEWLAVPAVLPGTQFYYVGMAMPVAVRYPLLAVLFAVPAPLLVPLVVIGWAVLLVWRNGWTAVIGRQAVL
jgi:hypothetical protein